jgi:hypothetical protein
MPHRTIAFCLILTAAVSLPAQTSGKTPTAGHYLFAWTGDLAHKGNDFLAVIDADPASTTYGHLVTTLVTDQQTVRIHHTEYTMPASGMLFANDHDAGRTFIFDVRDPLQPKIVTSFTDIGGYMHPHSYLRLPNGHVLAIFQHEHHGDHDAHMSTTDMSRIGGLVEIDDKGKVIRSASAADPAFPNALLTPYSLVVLPEIDRVVSTNSSMHLSSMFSGVTYQVWRLSDLKLLKTAYFDVGENRYAHVSPEEPRLGPDGSIFVQTLSCGVERITGVNTDEPASRLVYTFPANWCGVPTVVGHYLIQSVPALHGIVVLDIAHGDTLVEVSRVRLNDTFEPHWTGWDAKTQRIVVTGSEARLYLLKFDTQVGRVTIDEAFHDADGVPGFNLADREWPHGWKGSGLPHGVVASR